jgi:ABC-type nitrate/sulfonate/bicarbonate transport system permease component
MRRFLPARAVAPGSGRVSGARNIKWPRWPLASLASAASGLPALAFAVGLLLVWQLLAELRVISPVFFPAPSRAFEVLASRFADGSIWPSIEATSLRMLFGWVFASLLGIAIGAAIGSSAMARDFLEPTLEFLRPLPASAIIPVAILFLGLSNEMSVSVIAFGAIWPVLLSSIYGFGSLQVRLREVSAALGLGRVEFLRKIAFPAALPDILSGVRVSLAICLILAVVTEMQASLPGLGRDIFLAQRNFRSADLYAGLIMLGSIGFIVNYALLMVEQRLLRWRHPNR